ncbi:M20/M25/M40 family metallo-hydrolase [Dentiradicibacter hellwigii]|uniref:M20/M25/M40 family metallo-hydrolase n=1 Tax=Dentiradicibacter hellwigii TaxID=3149053 RepID=A0ABV4UE25_9RHOO
MDTALSDLLLKVCASQNIPCELIPSGAGHDSAMFANAGIPSAMLFVRNQHGSHNPEEAMDLDDFMLGAAALDQAIHEIR